ncbi:hypothetical protein CFOL_v3_24342, partial [Cephalotus follicularis]
LDMYETTKWDCPTDAAKYKKIVEKKQSYKFQLGLDKNLDEVRGRILPIKPLPNIWEVSSKLRREESRNKVMMGSRTNQPTTEGSTLAVRCPPYATNDNQPRKGRPWCDHCRKPGHTKDTCLKIHGKPADRKPSWPQLDRQSQGHNVAVKDRPASPTNCPFSKEQIEALQTLLNQQVLTS